jgi:LacI family transcriptional regulator
MRVTIREVAREAGVSVATVSRVLNGSGPASEEVAQRIREVAARLRYTPNAAARVLKGRPTHTLGVLLPDLYGEFFSEVIRGIDQCARRAGYHLLVSGSHDDPAEMEAALAAMRGRVDGMLLMSPDAATQKLLDDIADDMPTVLLSAGSAHPRTAVVTVDNAGGAQTMVRYLLGLGHRRIAIIRGTENNLDAAERLRGYREALRLAQIEALAEWEIPGDFTEQAGHAAIQTLLALSTRPTAIFAANDSMAIGAMAALREAGARVPDDFSIGGFDDIPIARHVTPALSSVHVAIDELGRRATERLVHALETGKPNAPTREVLQARLVERASCAAIGARGGERCG